LADLGLAAGDVTPINAAQGTWTTDDPAHTAAQAARQAKDGACGGLEGAIRPLVRRLQASPDVDDAGRAAMGITVPDQELSPKGGPPTSRPVVKVDTSQRLQHTIHFTDEATPTRKARPAGVMGAEAIRAAPVRKRSARLVRARVVSPQPLPHGRGSVQDPPPADPDELTFLAVDTRTPYTTDFDGADADKTAHYMLRWVSMTGEKGPPALDGPRRTKFAAAQRPLAACQGWSETASATVGA
jgi:hypothetical protein